MSAYDKLNQLRGCTRKEPYKTLSIAQKVADRLNQKGIQVQSYKCNYCFFYHIGHAFKRSNTRAERNSIK